MTVEELNELIEQKYSELKKSYEKDVEGFKTPNTHSFEDTGTWAKNYKWLVRKKYSWSIGEYTDIEELSDIVQQAKEELEFKQRFSVGATCNFIIEHIGEDDGDSEIVLSWYEPIASEEFEVIAKRELINYISDLLKPEESKNTYIVECKMLELFKNGQIDWKTLQSITYKDCQITGI